MSNAFNREQVAEPDSEGETNIVREAVAVFATEQALQQAIDDLQTSGFNRSEISILASNPKDSRKLELIFQDIRSLEDNEEVPRTAIYSPESRAEAEAAVIGIPIYIGAVGGMFAAVASGGTLALILAAAIAAGVAGGGAGAFGAYAIAHKHRKSIQQQLQNGGLLLWVRTADSDREQRAMEILKEAGGNDIHIHDINVKWSDDDVPLAHIQPDPFLERSPDLH